MNHSEDNKVEGKKRPKNLHEIPSVFDTRYDCTCSHINKH